MIKIYFNDKPLFITDEVTEEVKIWADKRDTIIIRDLSVKDVSRAITGIGDKETGAVVFLYPDTEAVLKIFRRKLVTIQAGGGFVCNEDGDVLLIFRRGKWDMPKGKLDEGEDLAACAVREVQEETGLQQIELQLPLYITYHTYYQRRQHILKESHWYLMRGTKHEILSPQTDEDIEICEWVKLSALPGYLGKMHAALPDMVKRGIEKLEAAGRSRIH